MKRARIIWIIMLLLLVAAAVWYFFFRTKETPVVLVTEKPQYGYISNSVTATGAIQPVDTVAVGTQVSGTIKNIYVDFNSVVKKGQLLAQLDKSLMLAQVQQIAANLQNSRSNLSYQQSNYNRQKELYTAGAISKAEFETAEYQLNSAKSNVGSISAQLQSAQKNLSFTDIFSPIDGTVLSRNVSEGQTVAASFSTPTLFGIAKDLTKMQVRASVDEADIGNVKKGERVTFTVDAFPNDVFNGTVQEIRLQPSVSSNVVTYTTIINAPNDDLKLKPGMTANISIFTKEIDSTLLIPAKAIRFTPDETVQQKFKVSEISTDPNKKRNNNVTGRSNGMKRDSTRAKNDSMTYQRAFVWLKKGDSLVQKRILTGLSDDINVQVVRGLSVNDEIVTGVQTGEQKKQSSDKSPFMPQRPRTNQSSGATRRN